MASYVIRSQYGAFCSACQSPLGLEEDDWDVCDTCGGDGMDADDFDDALLQVPSDQVRTSAPATPTLSNEQNPIIKPNQAEE